jgi:hypothetical protein
MALLSDEEISERLTEREWRPRRRRVVRHLELARTIDGLG